MPHGAIPFPFGNCRVCDDNATGVHYGVATCEGCKGFFKRSIPKADKYRCLHGGSCVIKSIGRNKCKACRYKKCCSVGMSIEGVKMGRIPKAEKLRALELHRRESLGCTNDENIHESGATSSAQLGQDVDCFLVRDSDLQTGQVDPAYSQTMRNQEKRKHSADFIDSGHCSSTLGKDFVQSDAGAAVLATGSHSPDFQLSGSRSTSCALDKSHRKNIQKQSWRPLGIENDRLITFKTSYQEMNSVGVVNDPGNTDDHSSRVLIPASLRDVAMSYTGGRNSPTITPTDAVPCKRSDWAEARPSCRDPCGREVSEFPQDFTHLQTDAEFSPADEHKLCMTISKPSVGVGLDAIAYPSKFSQMPLESPFHSGSSAVATLNPPIASSRSEKMLTGARTKSLSQPYYPIVIRELLDQVIKTGHGKELQQTFVKRFILSKESELPVRNLEPLYSNCGLSGFGSYRPLESYSDFTRKSWCFDKDETFPMIGRSSSPGSSAFISKLGSASSLATVSAVRGKETFDELRFGRLPSQNDGDAIVKFRRVGEDERWPSSDCDAATEENVVSLAALILEESVDEKKKSNVEFLPDALGSLDTSDSDFSRKTSSMSSPLSSDTSSSILNNDMCVQDDPLKMDDIETTLNCLGYAARKFFEASYRCLEMWNEEMHGIRPTHLLNQLLKATPKDITFVWNDLIASIPVYNSSILELCSNIPGFDELDTEDRAVLMEAAYFDLWLIGASPLFINGDSYLRLLCGARYTRWWMEHFLPESLVNAMFGFVEELNGLGLTPTELVIVCALQLTKCENKNLKNSQKVQYLHNYYLDLLAYLLERNHTANHSRILIKIFHLLPTLIPMNIEQVEALLNFRIDQPPEESFNSVSDTDDDDDVMDVLNCTQ